LEQFPVKCEILTTRKQPIRTRLGAKERVSQDRSEEKASKKGGRFRVGFSGKWSSFGEV